MSGRSLRFICLLSSSLTLSAQSREILLDVVVTDRSSQPVPALQQSNFTILDNKTPQAITSFHAEPAAEVIFVTDEVNTPYQAVLIGRQQLERYLKQGTLPLGRPSSLVFFSDAGTLLGATPSRDRNALLTDLAEQAHRFREGRRSQGAYGAFERLQLSLDTLGRMAEYEANRPGHKLVIWISPGWALLTSASVRLTPKNEQQIFRSIVSISQVLRQSRITICSVDPLGVSDADGLHNSYYKEYLKGVREPKQVQLADVSLQVIATQTGGLVLNTNNDIAGELARCFADATTSYQLTYDAPVATSPDEYHQIEIKMSKPGLTARTRTGYYGQPVPNP